LYVNCFKYKIIEFMPVAWLESINNMPIFNLWPYVPETEDVGKLSVLCWSEGDADVSKETDKIFLSGIYMSL